VPQPETAAMQLRRCLRSACAPVQAALRLVGGTNGCWLQRAHQLQGLDAGQVDVHVVAGGDEVQPHALCRHVRVLLRLKTPGSQSRQLLAVAAEAFADKLTMEAMSELAICTRWQAGQPLRSLVGQRLRLALKV